MVERFSDLEKKEFQFPETTYSTDIEVKVFQGIVLQVLSKIEGVSVLGGTFMDALLGRDINERFKGIIVQQQKNGSLFVRVEINIFHGYSIPQKAQEIQEKVVEEIVALVGLHVSGVHVIFKNLLPSKEGLSYLSSKEETVLR